MVCLDTTFIIDLLRGREEAESLIERLDKDNEIKLIASPTIMEVISGAFQGNKLKDDREKIMHLLTKIQVLSLGKDEAIIAGDIESNLMKIGGNIGAEDIMIAAICIKNSEPLVTRNKKHFEKISNLKIIAY